MNKTGKRTNAWLWLTIREGHAVPIEQAAVFKMIFAISLGMLIWYLRALKLPPNPAR